MIFGDYWVRVEEPNQWTNLTNEPISQSCTWSDNAIKGTVVNRALPSLWGGALKIMITFPFSVIFSFKHSCTETLVK